MNGPVERTNHHDAVRDGSSASETGRPFLSVSGLTKYFPIRKGLLGKKIGDVKAVRDVSFELRRGKTLSLMGESGCGKTTCGLAILRLTEPTAGTVRIGDYDVTALRRREMKAFRQDAQMIFQDPQEPLDPRMNVRSAILEPMRIHGRLHEGTERLGEIIDRVGFPRKYLRRYPRELSGGLQQRVCLSRALILQPSFLVLDEPTSALDVSVQARVLDLLLELRAEFGLTYLFISHDAAVVRYLSDWVAVMYLGQVVELGRTEQVFARPTHPYTQALCSAVLTPQSRIRVCEVVLHGSPPSPVDLPDGCAFAPRCAQKDDACKPGAPEMIEVDAEHFVLCHRCAEEVAVR
ncbi:ABC transporter ATP-binding protein [Candidatus Bipolaricaulota bacterium]